MSFGSHGKSLTDFSLSFAPVALQGAPQVTSLFICLTINIQKYILWYMITANTKTLITPYLARTIAEAEKEYASGKLPKAESVEKLVKEMCS